ncbi:leucine Rich repeat-containing domain protein [Necator americanus]|uniref:Leucine Rich repeat-containing domain protein n=1 Tax=Necator americanus TaxID=51031 RepID=W2TIF8_NECAM|nr:leucine Rich repeat-containing domain protein [Necator americanus]ETN81359.1 leucine Rich repeat-containing domain protein [Necator americanus]
MLRQVRAMFLVLLASLASTTFVAAQCPAISGPCRCAPSIYEPVAIICENAGSLSNALQAIQPARDISIDSLTILDTAIPNIPANAFVGFTILRLVLNRNTLQSIDDQAFNGPLIDSLVELDLNDNNLGQIPQTGLTRLRNLRKLYLNRNRINTLASNAFAGYESKDLLIKLSLAGNRLTDQSLTDTAVFRPLRLLQELSLETNALTAIPSAALVNQRGTLTNLNLGLNNINEVPVGALDFPNLTSLSLEFNGITVIPPQAFQGVPNLQYLYLTGNKFPSWAPEMFRYITQLRTLGIGETPISVIPNNAFMVSVRDFFRIVFSSSFPNEEPQPLTGKALSLVGWIILAIIMTILLISICLLAMVRYGMSHRRKKQKDQEIEDDARMMSSAASVYGVGPVSVIERPYSTVPPVSLDLPAAHTLDDRASNYFY